MLRHALRAALSLSVTLLLGSTALSTSPASSSAQPDRMRISVGDSADRVGWKATPRHRARLSSSRRVKRGERALRVTATGKGRISVHRTRATRLGAPRGTRHVVRVWVRASRAGQRGRLVVRERHEGRVVQRKGRSAELTRGAWTRITLPIRSQRAGSRLRITVRSPWQHRGDVLLVDLMKVATEPATAPPSTRECSVDARGLPSCGTYLGAAYGANTDPTDWERELGGTLALRRTYFRADQVAGAVRHARSDLADGRLPWISFKLPHSWEQMARGHGDAWAKDLATRLDALDGPVWVAFHHEPEGDGDIDAWRRMQERLGPIVRRGDNVAFTVVVTGWHQFYGDPQFRLANMWPQGIKVDVAGFDVYNSLGVVKDGKENTKGTDLPTAYFEKIKAWADAEGVAWGLAETGYTDKAAAVDPRWIERTYGEMRAMGGVAFAYFNTTLNSIAPWHIDSGTKQTDFTRALRKTIRLPR